MFVRNVGMLACMHVKAVFTERGGTFNVPTLLHAHATTTYIHTHSNPALGPLNDTKSIPVEPLGLDFGLFWASGPPGLDFEPLGLDFELFWASLPPGLDFEPLGYACIMCM